MAITETSPRTLEWTPVIAGTILACATSLMLMQFGHALGLSFPELYSQPIITAKTVIVLGLWTLWAQLCSSLTGAYLAGRLLTPWSADHESELRDGAHGLMVWALSTLVIAFAFGFAAFLASFAADQTQEVQTTISDAMVRKIGIISGFSLFAISLVSAVFAWGVATVAGDHRDRKVDVRRHTSFRKTVRTVKARAKA